MAPRPDPDGRGATSAHNEGSALGHDRLAHQLAVVARRLEAERSPGLMLDEIVHAAVELIPGVDEGSISVVIGRRGVSSRHPSGELPEKVDALQMEVGEGPCLDAAEQAFATLVKVSQDNNRKLFDVAGELSTTGRIDQ